MRVRADSVFHGFCRVKGTRFQMEIGESWRIWLTSNLRTWMFDQVYLLGLILVR